MTNDEYTSMVDAGQWLDDPAVPLDVPFVNANGKIQNLVLKPMTSVACIESEKGAVRANHFHKTDWHYTYVVSGAVAYAQRPVGSVDEPEFEIFRAGSMFFTRPMIEHAMVFTEKTVIITMARNVRSHERHEDDVVRVQFVSPKAAADVVALINGG